MDSSDREVTRIARRALDDALVSLGRRPVSENPDFWPGEPVPGDFPTVVLEAPGVAPFQFVLGPDVDVWVGPFSEVVLVEASAETEATIRSRLRDVLLSTVTSRRRRWSTEIVLRVPGAEPWMRLRSYGRFTAAPLEPAYRPYVER